TNNTDTNPATWVRAPMRSFTAVREPLALGVNPWVRPDTMLAAPNAASSWVASPFWLCSPANDRAVRIESQKLTRNTPTATGNRWRTSVVDTDGIFALGNPLGIVPTTATPCAWRSAAALTM